jgi:hypothetical protein
MIRAISMSITWVAACCFHGATSLAGDPFTSQRTTPQEAIESIQAIRRSVRRDSATYHSESDSLAFQTAFRHTLQATELDDILLEWDRLGFRVVELQFDSKRQRGDRVWLVYEAADVRTGGGVYAIRPAGGVPLVVQAPHAYSDLHTDKLLDQLVIEGPLRVAAWNSVDRKVIDVAHVDRHPLQDLTRAVAELDPRTNFVQLHGFRSDQRQSAQAQQASWILSDGSHSPSTWIVESYMRLRRGWHDHPGALFPHEVQELGATTNQQGRLLRQLGHDRFASVEMNASLRLQLLDDVRLRDKFLKVWTPSHREDEDR